jgi:hypothetical protein
MQKTWVVITVFFVLTGCAHEYKGANIKNGSESSYSWLTGKLIPNEFGLADGTWSDATIRECIAKCSAAGNCFGFSVEKKFGDAWEAGCSGTLCDEKTECHAKGDYGSSPLWLPTDAKIRVPAVDARSNAWITEWGTILKK